MIPSAIDSVRHPVGDPAYVAECRSTLDADGAVVLKRFFTPDVIKSLVREFEPKEKDAFYADSTHNVYLTESDPSLGADHPFNRQVTSSKGLVADDEIPADSILRSVYNCDELRAFLGGVLVVEAIYPYADEVSSTNVHFASEGRELG